MNTVYNYYTKNDDDDDDDEGNDKDDDDDNQPYLVRVTLNSNADKPVALILHTYIHTYILY